MSDALLMSNARAILNGANGVLATYTDGDGEESTVTVLLMSRRRITGHGWSGEYADIYVHKDDATPAIGDSFTIAGETWIYRPEASVTLEGRSCGGFWVCPCSLGVKGAA